MFTTLIVQPIFNLLVLIYALLPGHNFGLAIILFTIVVRVLMWPLVKKQLHQAKAMRELQPELKKIKVAAKGDKQKESLMMMELYKEREINPFGTIGLLVVQIPIFIALYNGLHRIVADPKAIVNFSYPVLQNFSWLQTLAKDIGQFDNTLLGIVELTKPAITNGVVYWPAMLIVIASAVMQYYQAKQIAPDDDNQKSLRKILKEAGQGQQADQADLSAAVGRSTRFMLPAFIFLVTVNIASALSLYWLVSGVIAYVQQARVLNQDKTELTTATEKESKTTTKAEILPPKNKHKTTKKTGKKRRK